MKELYNHVSISFFFFRMFSKTWFGSCFHPIDSIRMLSTLSSSSKTSFLRLCFAKQNEQEKKMIFPFLLLLYFVCSCFLSPTDKKSPTFNMKFTNELRISAVTKRISILFRFRLSTHSMSTQHSKRKTAKEEERNIKSTTNNVDRQNILYSGI